jgi:ABC-type uncharacterized transport system involved in gliding motility auxiliary subunit
MTPEWRLIARRASISISIIALVIGVGFYIVLRQWNLFLQICLGIFVIGIAIYVALDPGAIRKALTGRHGRYGINALILTVAFLGILVVVNYLVYKNTKRWDLTADQSNTLAKETLAVLKSLPDTVKAKAFYSSDVQLQSSKESTKTLLDQYVYDGGGKFQYEIIDPNKDPVSAQDAGITKDGSVVLFMGNNSQPVTDISEQELTGAIVRLMNPGSHVVYFLTGHGEFPIDGSSGQSYTQLSTALTSKNYTVSTLNLLSTNKIPTDASVIVIAGPQKPLSEYEVSMLDAYMNNGGSMVVMEEPTVLTQFEDSPDPLANYIAQTYGIVLGDDIVVDVTGDQSLQQPFVVIGIPSSQHEITQELAQTVTGFPTARSVTADESLGNEYSKTDLILTVEQSWGETDMTSLQNQTYEFNQDMDKPGPISLAVTSQGGSNNTRLVVFGDADFALDTNFGFYGNSDMIINSIDWAAKEESLINLTPKTTVERYLVQPKSYTVGMIFLGSLVVLPGVIIIAGIGTWVMRRKQG